MLLDGSSKEGSVSRAYLHCLNHVQRPRSVTQAVAGPGSRMSAPWILRSKRGLPQYTHANLPPLPRARAQTPGGTGGLRPGFSALACRSAWSWRERDLQAKIAAFPGATARRSPPPKSGCGVSGRTAFCRPPLSTTPQACWREAGTETVPPIFPHLPMPP